MASRNAKSRNFRKYSADWFKARGWQIVKDDNGNEVFLGFVAGDIQKSIDHLAELREQAKAKGFVQIAVEVNSTEWDDTLYYLWGTKEVDSAV